MKSTGSEAADKKGRTQRCGARDKNIVINSSRGTGGGFDELPVFRILAAVYFPKNNGFRVDFSKSFVARTALRRKNNDFSSTLISGFRFEWSRKKSANWKGLITRAEKIQRSSCQPQKQPGVRKYRYQFRCGGGGSNDVGFSRGQGMQIIRDE